MPLEQNALARLLQERREAAGYSRARLGNIVGISAGTIEGWELGRVERPPFHEVMRIAAFLKIPLDDIQRVAFADAGAIPDPQEHPGQLDRKKPGRKKRLGGGPPLGGRLPLLCRAGRNGLGRCRFSRPPSASMAGRTKTRRQRRWGQLLSRCARGDAGVSAW